MNILTAFFKFLDDNRYIFTTLLLCSIFLYETQDSKYSDEELNAINTCQLQQGKWIEIDKGGYCD
ncbi:hypothetical protein [Phocoenobacter skyensis]|uniref:Uncharacterized protein n=1 Tax=Phocoenobacter skyensis TaxID=97481 RepID=A0ABT9JIA8_9PAST|nr:hypothetical protein [Pasteurella skyensis]MDP8078365.1 hypothetical protein [Pasteurella skyensis]MDP8084543.1 hypothetical protein [Pasteurella skyensis]